MALTKYNSQKRLEIEKKANQQVQAALGQNEKKDRELADDMKEEFKLREIIDKDAEMA